ncbi:tRNA (adenosine(37)-N6)-threonylcarbamoyltransferase complex ATPase subunit type 1 TsaE [Orrella sp. NBD-18]|uniref:tRNA threonylcarbamoyladenosine biosynthesis protein TsaE n=1 Tax=Sheuella amnicola TaxID=2707330 RepID=A0A6B2QYZ8_9BURK|nr:tRNA (adenosine(37)-N6)-threonylcarbamoyltransferase complex ATPase subunit type 1 TsaE [Sheuella amnicola]NDY83816.1 tRNA (adenosine(37)-N6)-threonylcarbamoyltransferase complex ATPase subunit type 1 TsaE [Sheuella amnicola]HBI82288.1 tRNA (adenosine(37)-N6)-threonylcarbamoyltransferase complex ATPase subunit type 1 TsaE [Alcaligenaceae bacterium]
MTKTPPLLTLSIDLPDESATEALGRQLAVIAAKLHPDASGRLIPGDGAGGRIHLQGDLGAGKTSLVRAFLRHCGVSGRIKSPSYALLESYEVFNLYLYHLDFYRFSDPTEWLDAGFRDLMQENALILIEWPERAEGFIGDPDILINLRYAETGRHATIDARTGKGLIWLTALNLQRTEQRPTSERQNAAS